MPLYTKKVTARKCRLMTGLAIFALPVTLFATQDYDPSPYRPPLPYEVDPTVDLLDVPTKANTVQFDSPTPLATREPAISVQRRPAGVLSGRIVYTSPGHGRKWGGSSWTTDRPAYNQIVEDFGNQDQFTYWCYYLFNSGATVVPFRPIGNQTNEVIVDNPSLNVTWTGTWSNNIAGPQYYGNTADAVKYRFTLTQLTETAAATYLPNIPARGYYPVYAWAANSNNRSADQLYRVKHSGFTFK